MHSRSVAAFSLELRTLAAGSGWNKPALLVAFQNGLNPEVLTKLACTDDALLLYQLTSLSTGLDQLLQCCTL